MGKINDIENRTILNSNIIVNLVSDNKILSSAVTKANITQYNNKYINVIESEWIDFNSLQYADGSGQIQYQYLNFTTIFENFPENLIPFISSTVIFNQVDDVPSVVGPAIPIPIYLHPETNMYFNSLNDGFVGTRYGDLNFIEGNTTFQIEDINGSTLKKVRVLTVAKTYMGHLTDEQTPQFQGKLVLTMINPNDFSRIS